MNVCDIVFGFTVLQLMKTSQAQHGLRRGDYSRYRYLLYHTLSSLAKKKK